jgi:WASH complex subunit CCDC53
VTQQAESQSVPQPPPQQSTSDSNPPPPPPPPPSEPSKEIITVSKDPRFSKYFKMLIMGVPVAAVKLKMNSEGIDPNLLDTPDAPAPEAEGDDDDDDSDSDY